MDLFMSPVNFTMLYPQNYNTRGLATTDKLVIADKCILYAMFKVSAELEYIV